MNDTAAQRGAVVHDVVAPASSPVALAPDAADVPDGGIGDVSSWRPKLRAYEHADWRSAFQLVTAVAMFVAGWWLALRMLDVHYGLALLASVVIAVAIVRFFILFHDCGHGSFSRSRRLNDTIGSLLGIMVFTPFRYWNYAHAMHHATSSDLDRRGVGDVWTMTTDEYRAASLPRRIYYRGYHSPWVMFTIGPLIKFLVIERIVTRPDTTPKRVIRSVHFTNVGIVVVAVAMMAVLGPGRYLAIQVPALVIGGSGAIWLFYVQHRFDEAYWSRRTEWQYVDAALRGSSYLRLGPVGRYVSGNIGFHHLHHLDPRIPNYHLPRCAREHPELQPHRTFGLRESWHVHRLKLWDERTGRYVGYEAATR